LQSRLPASPMHPTRLWAPAVQPGPLLSILKNKSTCTNTLAHLNLGSCLAHCLSQQNRMTRQSFQAGAIWYQLPAYVPTRAVLTAYNFQLPASCDDIPTHTNNGLNCTPPVAVASHTSILLLTDCLQLWPHSASAASPVRSSSPPESSPPQNKCAFNLCGACHLRW
jgi:hypothetical protein